MQKLNVKEAEAEAPAVKPAGKTEPEPEEVVPKSPFPSLITKKAELYLWDRDDGHFLKQADIYASVAKHNAGYTFLITAMTSEGQQLLAHKLSSDLNARWSTKLASLTWNYTSVDGTISSWCFKFENTEDFKEFQEVYGGCMYEALNQSSWEKAKVKGSSERISRINNLYMRRSMSSNMSLAHITMMLRWLRPKMTRMTRILLKEH